MPDFPKLGIGIFIKILTANRKVKEIVTFYPTNSILLSEILNIQELHIIALQSSHRHKHKQFL